MPDDLQQSLVRFDQKLDTLLRDKVDLRYYDDRHKDLESRVGRVEQRVDTIEKNIAELHNSSMEKVNEMFTAMERRILDKIEANAKFSLSNWLFVAVAIVGWIVAIIGVVVAIPK